MAFMLSYSRASSEVKRIRAREENNNNNGACELRELYCKPAQELCYFKFHSHTIHAFIHFMHFMIPPQCPVQPRRSQAQRPCPATDPFDRADSLLSYSLNVFGMLLPLRGLWEPETPRSDRANKRMNCLKKERQGTFFSCSAWHALGFSTTARCSWSLCRLVAGSLCWAFMPRQSS